MALFTCSVVAEIKDWNNKSAKFRLHDYYTEIILITSNNHGLEKCALSLIKQYFFITVLIAKKYLGTFLHFYHFIYYIDTQYWNKCKYKRWKGDMEKKPWGS